MNRLKVKLISMTFGCFGVFGLMSATCGGAVESRFSIRSNADPGNADKFFERILYCNENFKCSDVKSLPDL